jgi:hypothetical protein
MPSSIIDNDVDIVFYEFAAQGSLHYGLLMFKQAQEWWGTWAFRNDPSLTMAMAKANALSRHAKDYMHGAAYTVRLLINSYPEDADSLPAWQSLKSRALEAMAEVNDFRREMDIWAEKHVPDLSEYTAKAHVQWMALLSDRSFYTKEI